LRRAHGLAAVADCLAAAERATDLTTAAGRSRDETKEAPQWRFHGVSEVLETVRIRFVAMKRIPSLSPFSFVQNTDVAPY
jgi:hypothetical protein